MDWTPAPRRPTAIRREQNLALVSAVVSGGVIAAGLILLLVARVNPETASGVPAAVIAAIWGIETSYGRVLGRYDLPSALATLAFDGRRRDLFTRELDAAVQMVGEGRVAREAMKGSWAGAFGQTQFLPSSYLAYGRDGDGDGKACTS